MYSYTSNKKNVESIVGTIFAGDTLKFTNPGTVVFYTNPAISCTFIIGGINDGTSDQIAHVFSSTGLYTGNVTGGINVNFYVKIGGNITPGTGKLMRIISETTNGSNYQVLIRMFNQLPGALISQYGIVGNGYNGASFTPLTGVQTFTTGSNNDSLDITINIPQGYSGRVTINNTRSSSWFSATYNGISTPFFDPTFDGDGNGSPDNLFSFFINANGGLTYYNGVVIIPGQNFNLPGKWGDDDFNAIIRGEVTPATGNYILYFKVSVGTTISYKGSATDGSNIPSGSWSTLTTTVCATNSGYSEITIPAAQMTKYFFMNFGSTTLMSESIKFWQSNLNICELMN